MQEVELREEVGRLRRALCEEREVRKSQAAALWSAIENLREDVRCRAILKPTGPEAADGESGEAPGRPTETAEASRRSTRDVTTQTDEAKPTGSVNIYHLENNHLKHIIGFLECGQLLVARRVCKRWKTVVDDVLEDFRKTHEGDLEEDSLPQTDTHLLLILRENPDIIEVRAPEQGDLDLNIVASCCKNLKVADLRGFSCRAESLDKLARQNSQLTKVLLPAGCHGKDIEELLRHSTGLEDLTVYSPDGPGQWLQLLPPTLRRLVITALEAPLEQCLSLTGLAGLQTLGLHSSRGVTDRTLASLPGLTPGLNWLGITDCPGVTAVGLHKLERLTQLSGLGLYDFPSGTTAEMLDSLHGCSELQKLLLGRLKRPETAIPAAAVSRLAAACRKLYDVYVHTTAANIEAILDDLLQTDLGSGSDGSPRIVQFYVPGPVYSQLTVPPAGSRIELHELEE